MMQGKSDDTKSSRVTEFIASPRRAVWTLAIPVMVGMAVQTVYSFVDMIFVGRLGGDAIAALTFNMPLVFFSIGITFGLGSGATSVIARRLGADDKRGADNAAEHAILIGVSTGVIIVLIALLYKRLIFSLLGAPEHVAGPAIEYFQIIAMGFIFTILNVMFRAIMTGEGDTRTPIAFQVAGTLLNVVLDPILIFWAGLGIAGAAWATIASQFAVLLAFLYFFFIRRGTYLDFAFGDFSPSREIVGQILRIGIPSSLSLVIMSVAGMFYNRIIVTFGSAAVAGFGVGGRLDSIYFMPTFALASSMVTLAGMFLGAKRIDLIRSTMMYTIASGEVLAIGMGIVFYVFAPQIFLIFTDEAPIIDVAVQYIRTLVFAFPFITFGIISSRTFQGLGSGLPGLVLTSLRVVVISVPLAYLFSHVLDLGLVSIWVAMLISAFAASVVALAWITVRLKGLEAGSASSPQGEQT